MWSLQAKFVHNPTRLDPVRSSITVEHECLSHPYDLTCYWIVNRAIFARGFPVPSYSSSIGPKPCSIFSISEAEEKPFLRVQLCHL